MTSHILIDSEGRPVPLPYYTAFADGCPVTIYDYREAVSKVLAAIDEVPGRHWLPITQIPGLSLISEADFMAAQEEAEREHLDVCEDHSCDFCRTSRGETL